MGALVIAGVGFVLASAVCADTWLPPRRTEYLSPDKTVRLTVIPRELAGALPHFEDKVKGKEPAGQRPGSRQTQARGMLERKDRHGRWHEVWDRPLVNEVAPTHALVANSTHYVVTFDNWHSAGYGKDVVVIYDAHGAVVRALALNDFLPEDYIKALPHSVSSIWWGGDHRLADGDTLVLQVVEPHDEQVQPQATYIEVRIRLFDGKVIPPSGPAWDRARSNAEKINAAFDASQRARAAKRAAPLVAPDSDDDDAWREYTIEAYVRLRQDDSFPRGWHLPAEHSADFANEYKQLSGWVNEALSKATADTLMFSSPASDRLADLLVDAAHRVPPGTLRGVRIYFVGHARAGGRVAKAFADTGAKYVLVDVDKPIAPKPAN